MRFAICLCLLGLTASAVHAADGEGTARVSPVEAEANTVGTWTVTYKVGPSGIATGGGVKVQFPKAWIMHPYSSLKAVQYHEPDANHHVTARASRPGVALKLAMDN